jgi:hypothetical protein
MLAENTGLELAPTRTRALDLPVSGTAHATLSVSAGKYSSARAPRTGIRSCFRRPLESTPRDPRVSPSSYGQASGDIVGLKELPPVLFRGQTYEERGVTVFWSEEL